MRFYRAESGVVGSTMDPKFRELGYPEISPVTGDAPRPRWSVMIPTYNCAELLRETLSGVLAEGIGPDEMQIEVIDDCSTKDRPEDVVAELGKGRVSFYRHPKNVGAVANFNACIERARGALVHILHGDDLIMPGFYRAMEGVFTEWPGIGSAYCQNAFIDVHGNWTGLAGCLRRDRGIIDDIVPKMAVANLAQFAAVVVKREIYEEIGGFHPTLVHTADWDMWKRAACVRPVGYYPRPLACYRVFEGNDTSRLKLTAEDKRDGLRAIELAGQYLPNELRSKSIRQARYLWGRAALADSLRFQALGLVDAAAAQINAAIELNPRNACKPSVWRRRVSVWLQRVMGRPAIAAGR